MIKIKNARALYVEEDRIWVAKGLSYYSIDFNGKQISKTIKVGSGLYRIRLLRQLLRKGIHHLLPLKNGNILITLKQRTLILDQEGKVVNEFKGYHGNKPGHRGVCVTPNGYIFFGEYSLNNERKLDINLFRSIDNGQSFQIIKTFQPGEIRHIHFIEWDESDKCIWMGTGDYGQNNEECRLYRSFDYGETFEMIGSGSQKWRSIAICSTNDDLFWGTDAGHSKDKNYVLRYSKADKELICVDELTGPCHGMCVTKDGRIFISSGVEGGENELDKFAKLYEINIDGIQLIKQIKKDIYPYIVQYGVIRFPMGCVNSDKLIYTMMGLKNNGECIYIE